MSGTRASGASRRSATDASSCRSRGNPKARTRGRVIISPERGEPELGTHAGSEWLYVLSGELRLILAELLTALPHWFGRAGDHGVEILSLLSRQGEPMHVRAASRAKNAADEH